MRVLRVRNGCVGCVCTCLLEELCEIPGTRRITLTARNKELQTESDEVESEKSKTLLFCTKRLPLLVVRGLTVGAHPQGDGALAVMVCCARLDERHDPVLSRCAACLLWQDELPERDRLWAVDDHMIEALLVVGGSYRRQHTRRTPCGQRGPWFQSPRSYPWP